MSIYKALLRVPILGSVLYIFNSYVLRGDDAAVVRAASLLQIIRIFFFPWIWAALLTLLMSPHLVGCVFGIDILKSTFSDKEFSGKSGEIITTIFPNLLGFGIGVYALIFSISSPFLSKIDNKINQQKLAGKRKFGSALVFNVDLAFPLLVIILTLIVGVFQQGYTDVPWLRLAAWFSFWYASVTMIEIVAVLFGLGEHALLEKIPGDEKPPQ